MFHKHEYFYNTFIEVIVKCHDFDILIKGWVECSPYEVFMPKYGTGIDMKYFGSEFDGGFVKTKNPEQPLHVLQGNE